MGRLVLQGIIAVMQFPLLISEGNSVNTMLTCYCMLIPVHKVKFINTKLCIYSFQ